MKHFLKIHVCYPIFFKKKSNTSRCNSCDLFLTELASFAENVKAVSSMLRELESCHFDQTSTNLIQEINQIRKKHNFVVIENIEEKSFDDQIDPPQVISLTNQKVEEINQKSSRETKEKDFVEKLEDGKLFS